MAVIIRASVQTAFKGYRCESYLFSRGCKRLIHPGEKYLRIFGSAHGDHPYEIMHCMPCAEAMAERDNSMIKAVRAKILSGADPQ